MQEYLTFKLASEEYCIDILKVQEIRNYSQPTRIANVPEFIKGVINLRGAVVPIMDLRIKFNCEEILYNKFTVVIILNIKNKTVGIVVDSVSDVINLDPKNILEAPDFEGNINSNFVNGLVSIDERMLILLDIVKMLEQIERIERLENTKNIEEIETN